MNLCEITIPGLRGAASMQLARTTLVRQFPDVLDVLAARRRRTVLVVFLGQERRAEWAVALDRALRSDRPWRWRRLRRRRDAVAEMRG
jgi:hypothetical protein